jgi:hypothetical protein
MTFGSHGLLNNVKAEQPYMKLFLSSFLSEQNAYTTKSGDNLSTIAKKHNMSLPDLLTANPQIEDPNRIGIGDSINIPGINSTDNRKNIAPPTKTEAQRFSPKKYGMMMLDQGDKFLKYGNEPNLPGYDKKYDYGGSGDIPRDDKAYRQVATGVGPFVTQ